MCLFIHLKILKENFAAKPVTDLYDRGVLDPADSQAPALGYLVQLGLGGEHLGRSWVWSSIGGLASASHTALKITVWIVKSSHMGSYFAHM